MATVSGRIGAQVMNQLRPVDLQVLMDVHNARYFFATTRILLAFTFLWSFADKLLGLGYPTRHADGWAFGGSPTYTYFRDAVNANGPFGPYFHALAQGLLVDWAFMLAILFVGLALATGILMRIASAVGAAIMILQWAALLPFTNNPLVDFHLVFAAVLLTLPVAHAGRTWGFGTWWFMRESVERHPVLE